MEAEARVRTEKGSRYLQALCGHFSRKTRANYTAEQGTVDFGVGSCELRAEQDALLLHADAPDEISLEQVKDVVGGHLERFAAKDELTVTWTDVQVT